MLLTNPNKQENKLTILHTNILDIFLYISVRYYSEVNVPGNARTVIQYEAYFDHKNLFKIILSNILKLKSLKIKKNILTIHRVYILILFLIKKKNH